MSSEINEVSVELLRAIKEAQVLSEVALEIISENKIPVFVFALAAESILSAVKHNHPHIYETVKTIAKDCEKGLSPKPHQGVH